MRKQKIDQLLFLRLLLILATLGLSAYLYGQKLIYSSAFVAFVGLLLLYEMYAALREAFLFYDRTIASILQGDFSSDFSKHKGQHNYARLFELYHRLRDTQHEQLSRDLIYQSILNNIESGILILQKDTESWRVFLMNDYFSEHFQAPKVSHWKYLREKIPALCELVEKAEFGELKTALQIRVNKEDTQTFMLQTSATKAFEQDYYIIMLDSIQKVVERKEKEAWINLMKVISHELLNSLTPIRSLSQNLNELVDQEQLSSEDIQDIRLSVRTMLNRSNHLQEFVESYRKLAMLPSPQKEKVELSELVESCLQIMQPLYKSRNITAHNEVGFKRWIWVDKNQMEQVLINLLTNSMYSLEDKPSGAVFISCALREKRIYLTISDNGLGIDPAIEDKIFLPFFTTRKDGAGIGLTLSKNIVEAHGGYLAFESTPEKTSFTVCLLE